jgi:receptor protein-tyrosine kinase
MTSDPSSVSGERSLDLIATLRVLRQRAPLIAICVLLTGGAAFVLSKAQHKEYTATAHILFRNAQLDQQAAGLQVVNQTNPQPQADTNLKLATLPRVAAETATALDHGLTQKQVSNAISVGQESDTDLASVSATWTSPAFAAQMANTYAQKVIADRQRADANYYANALEAVNLEFKALTPTQQRGVEGADLKDRASSLQILNQLQSGEVQLEQAASPPSGPSSPKIVRNTLLGAFVGLLLGLGLAFLLYRIDRRLREPSDLEDVYRVPLLAVVPESSALRQPQSGTGSMRQLPPAEAEIFGLLRAHIRYFNVDRQMKLMVIVSAAPGDGKTTVARNLAMAAATVGSRVLYVEADLRRPVAAGCFGIASAPGLSEVLLGEDTLGNAVQTVEFAARKGANQGVDVLVAGGVLPPNPPQVMESLAMETLLDSARSDYDLVVIDTPPLVLLPDAFPLIRRADGVVIVSRLGQNRSDVASRLGETLEGVDAPVVGVVANGYKRRGGTSAYGYAYTYDYTQYSTADQAAVHASPNGSSADRTTAVGPH